MNTKKRIKETKIKVRKSYKKLELFVRKNLFRVVGGLLIVLLILIVAGSLLRREKEEEKAEKEAIPVSVFQVGETPRTRIIGQVEKENVYKISALASGIVQEIYVKEGDYIYKNANLAYISTNYQGGNAATIQRQLAEKQYNNVLDTFDKQVELIDKQKEVAEKTDKNADDLREINEKSIAETEEMIRLNEEILDYFDENIRLYEATGSGQNRDLIYSAKQLKSTYLSALNQLKSSLRSLQYQTDNDNPPAVLSNLQKEATIKQLDLQEKSLKLNKEVSYLQYRLAQVNECLFYPSSVGSGIVQKVHVHVGDLVNPGMPLFTIKGEDSAFKIRANVSKKIADNINILEPSYVYVGGEKIEARPEFISTEATDGTLYNLSYIIPPNYSNRVADGENIGIEIPVGEQESGLAIPFVPIDAVYQSNSDSFVFVVKNGQAVSLKVELGEVFGSYAAVLGGIDESAQIILNRNVVEGDRVAVE